MGAYVQPGSNRMTNMLENHVDVCMRVFTQLLFGLENFPSLQTTNAFMDMRQCHGL
jgi:hypothetical protein